MAVVRAPRSMRLAVHPFGVLGTALTRSKVIEKRAALPAPGLPIVDPAGLQYIRTGPKGAGGASGEIYKWLGIAEDENFPDAVRSAIQAPLQAKMHFYKVPGLYKVPIGLNPVLHIVGPNFNSRKCSREEALGELTAAYSSILREFSNKRLGGLRMLPISGGIFAGPFAPELPTMTSIALRRAFDGLPNNTQHVISVARLEMCIFQDSEYDAYSEAFKEDISKAAEFARSLEMGSTPRQVYPF